MSFRVRYARDVFARVFDLSRDIETHCRLAVVARGSRIAARSEMIDALHCWVKQVKGWVYDMGSAVDAELDIWIGHLVVFFVFSIENAGAWDVFFGGSCR